jgi:class 3 adenylate cyclase/tetratricopeptide (TPR) repeat protein
MDRRQAQARGVDLASRSTGAALFADISGFTPLTESLVRALGPQRGAEELTHFLNRVYDALIAELYRYGGSVIGFSGDAITCWLDGDTGGRAAACALDMQAAMAQFAAIATPTGDTVSLAMKASVAAGSVRRFVVGDPAIQLIDVVAGRTLERLAAAEHLANRGEVVVDDETAEALRDLLGDIQWRVEEGSRDRVAVVRSLRVPIKPGPWPPIAPDALEEDVVRRWVLPAVYQRLHTGGGEFLAELRPAVALFLRFGGLDFEHDEEVAGKLDGYVRWVQATLARFEGTLVQLTVGDKGSYLYAAFGAPVAHEDDAVRAVSAAFELQSPPGDLIYIGAPQIGISSGRMRTGAYGAHDGRTYGVLGDETNMAARLMQAAAPGQVLVSASAQQAAAGAATWEQLAPLRVKGKADPVTVFAALAPIDRRTMRLQEPRYTLPMVGRAEELAAIRQHLALALEGRGQIVGITAEAGMGKSRLVAAAIRLGQERGVATYGGECQSYGSSASYLVWQSIWRDLFALDEMWGVGGQIAALERQLAALDPGLMPRLPLLGTVLNLPIPDTDLTRSFDAKLRKTSLEALLVDCLRALARQGPLLLVLEDCHWIDALSQDLLDVLGRAIAALPVLILLSYRPPDIQGQNNLRVQALAHFDEIRLQHFTAEEAERLIRLKLAQLEGAGAGAPSELVQRITARADGNPFYIEELLNYIRDRGLDPHDAVALEQIDLPASLHSLILSRIDQLGEREKVVLKVASILGRRVQAAWLWGAYAPLGDEREVRTRLNTLGTLDLLPLDQPEPELVLIFKHIITQEVAYESMPYATRATLHAQLGRFLEQTFAASIDQYVALLAFHYERTEDIGKKRHYLLRAGEAAQIAFANTAAFGYYQRALPLLPEDERIGVMQKTGEVLELIGRWSDAAATYADAMALAERLGNLLDAARSQAATGELLRKRGTYAEAATWLARARAGFEQSGDRAGIARVLQYGGTLAAQQGDYETARSRFSESLALWRALDERPRIADLLNNLAVVAQYQSDYATATALQEEALAIRRALDDRLAIATSLNNLGYFALDLGQQESARVRLEEAVALNREIGHRWGLANALNNLANVARAQRDFAVARALYEESLRINQELGDSWAIAYLLEDIGCLAAANGDARRALRLVGAASALRETTGAPLPASEQAKLDAQLRVAGATLSAAEQDTLLAEGRGLGLARALADALDASAG